MASGAIWFSEVLYFYSTPFLPGLISPYLFKPGIIIVQLFEFESLKSYYVLTLICLIIREAE